MKKIRFYIYCLISLMLLSFKPVLAENWEGVAACNLGPQFYSEDSKIFPESASNFQRDLNKLILLKDETTPEQLVPISISYKTLIESYIKIFGDNAVDEKAYFDLFKRRNDDIYYLNICTKYLGLDDKLVKDYEKTTQKFLVNNIGVTADIFDTIIKGKSENKDLSKYKNFLNMISSNKEIFETLNQSEYKSVFEFSEFKDLKPIIIEDKKCFKDHFPVPLQSYDIKDAMPEQAIEARKSGKVQVIVIVDIEGNVKTAHLTEYSHELYKSESPLRAATQVKFIPAFKDCQIIEGVYTFNIVFKIN